MPADLRLTALLEAAVEASGLPVRRLASGAGHDAAQMAALAPRGHALRAVQGGHKPQPCGVGYSADDAGAAIEVMGRFLEFVAVGGNSSERERVMST